MKHFGGIILCTVLLFSCGGNFDGILKYTVDSDVITVGIMSDLQLPVGAKDSALYVTNTKKALEYFKSRKIDVLINAGDLTDLSDDTAYSPYKACLDSVFGTERPVTVQVMGNHDYWNSYGKADTLTKLRDRFTRMTGDSPWTHKVVNGYHFLAISPANGDMDGSYGLIKNKIRSEIGTAVSQNPGKPVFIVTHQNPEDTVYGSDAWGNDDLTEIFSNYPQIISFSGHSHYSLLDERSIWQGSFTAINTQCVSYVELEAGKENGSIPPHAEDSPMVMIMEIRANEIRIIRYNLAKEREEKNAWTIPLPIKKEKFKYTTEKRIRNAVSPVFSEEAVSAGIETVSVKDEKTGKPVDGFRFTAASHADFVHSYKVNLNASGRTQTFFYFSDFCAGLSEMSPTPAFAFPKNLKPGTYNIEIKAVESFGKESKESVTGLVRIQ